MFLSTFDIGMTMLNLNESIARVIKTRKVTNAAFSKSLICSSVGLNSTLQPIFELEGGGLNL
jgi:hypothetical protein